jgi:molybdate transport system substrate-binding protein
MPAAAPDLRLLLPHQCDGLRSELIEVGLQSLKACCRNFSVRICCPRLKEPAMSINQFRRGLAVAGILGFLVAPLITSIAHAADITVFAAASLKNALDDAVKLYEAKTGDKVAISYAASPALAKQIESGAPADIFFSADLDWMDYLADKNLINTASRHTLLGNTLVLAAPKDSAVSLTIEKDFPLLEALGPDGKLAMASVDSVPAGKYGKAALTTLGVWDAVSSRVVQAENVRAALVFVARGEAPLGIVYGTDAKSEPAVKVVGTFPEQSHPKIQYPIALLAGAKPEARKLLDFLESAEAKPAFEAQGFTILAGQS